MTKNYYILSLKHSPIGNDAVWWRPDACGYTCQLDRAGIYDEATVQSNIGYYDNGKETRAIPVDTVLALAHTAVEIGKVRGL